MIFYDLKFKNPISHLQNGKIEEYLRKRLKNDYLITRAIKSVEKKVERGNPDFLKFYLLIKNTV